MTKEVDTVIEIQELAYNALKERASTFQEAGWIPNLEVVGLRFVGWFLEQTKLIDNVKTIDTLKRTGSPTYNNKAAEFIANLVHYHRYRVLAVILGELVQREIFDVVIDDINWLNRFRSASSAFEEDPDMTGPERFRDVFVLGRMQVEDRWYVLTVRRTTEGLFTNVYIYKEDEEHPEIWRNGLDSIASVKSKTNLANIVSGAYIKILGNLNWYKLLVT